MRNEIDLAKLSPADFAAQIERWLDQLEAPGVPTPEMQSSRTSARQALEQATGSARRQFLASLADRRGTAALEFAAREGLADTIRALSDAGVDVDTSLASSCGITPLIYAVQKGHEDAVRALLDAGADSSRQAMGTNALAVAIDKGHREIAERLLSHIDDAAELKYMGGTVLHLAAEKGPAEFVEALLSRGLAPDVPDHLNQTPLMAAAEHGNAAAAAILLAAGASTELPPPKKEGKASDLFHLPVNTPLLLAAKHGHAEVVRLLLAHGARTDVRDHEQLTPLDWARNNGHTDTAKLIRAAIGLDDDAFDGMDLLQAVKQNDLDTLRRAMAAGADVNYCDKPSQGKWGTIPGRTALMHAAMTGHAEAARLLIEAGAAPLKREDNYGSGMTGFEVVALSDQPAVLELILARMPEIDAKLRESALVEAARMGAGGSVAFLLDAGVKVDARGSYRTTPLIAAAGCGRAEVVRLLIERGAKLDLKSGGDYPTTALIAAVGNLDPRRKDVDEQGKEIFYWDGDARETIDLLLAAGADVNLTRKDGSTALSNALQYPDVVQKLLARGAEPNHRLGQDDTPLHRATFHEAQETVALLLAAGADAAAVDAKGRTALDIAIERNYSAIVERLRAGGGPAGAETAVGQQRQSDIASEEEQRQQRRVAAEAANKRLIPDFSGKLSTPEYQAAVAHLTVLCGAELRTADEVPGLAYGVVPLKRAKQLMASESAKFAAWGCYLFCCGEALSDDEEELLGILPTTDQWQVVAAIGTSAPNYDMAMSEVIDGLRQLYAMCPFKIAKASYDTIAGEFEELPADPKQLATFLYKFCPDIVDQGVGTKRKLEATLKKSKELFLWWD